MEPRRRFIGRKKCARRACDRIVSGRCRAEHRRRKFCSHRCNVLANVSLRRKRGLDDPSLRRDMRAIQKALRVDGAPPIALARAVRGLRARAYRAGWTVVTRKFRRAIARGILVHRHLDVAVS